MLTLRPLRLLRRACACCCCPGIEGSPTCDLSRPLNLRPPLPLLPPLAALLQDQDQLRSLIQRHVKYTSSTVGRKILLDWDAEHRNFVKARPLCCSLLPLLLLGCCCCSCCGALFREVAGAASRLTSSCPAASLTARAGVAARVPPRRGRGQQAQGGAGAGGGAAEQCVGKERLIGGWGARAAEGCCACSPLRMPQAPPAVCPGSP